MTPTPGVSFSSAPEHGRDYHAFGTENYCDPGRSSDKPVRSGPGKTGRRGAGNEGFPFQARRDSCRRRGPPVEVFFYPTGVRVFPLDAAGNAVDTSRLTASATVSYPGTPPERSLSRPLHPVPTDTGAAPSSLVASIGLADAPEKTTTVVLEIIGLSGTTASAAAFKIPLKLSPRQPPPARPPPPHQRLLRVTRRSQASAPTAIVRTSSLDRGLCPSLRKPRPHTSEPA